MAWILKKKGLQTPMKVVWDAKGSVTVTKEQSCHQASRKFGVWRDRWTI
jgi:hypothetical protein